MRVTKAAPVVILVLGDGDAPAVAVQKHIPEQDANPARPQGRHSVMTRELSSVSNTSWDCRPNQDNQVGRGARTLPRT